MPVKANGKNTSSTVFSPRKSLRVTGCPFWSLSVKSGASAPTSSMLAPPRGLGLGLHQPAGDPAAEVRRGGLHQPRGGRRLGDLRGLYVPRLAGLRGDHPDDAV